MTKLKNLFLLDGLGAILSAFLLGVVLVRFENIFGIPTSTLYILAFIPLFFALYDVYQYQQISAKSARSLKRIAIFNILYCCLSLGFAFYHHEVITTFGWAYILAEIIVVVSLAAFELRTANRFDKSNV
ncbi:hypothetical protein [Arcticibacterium luteifluviistationis]|uniref:Uncharacterized protein n=1 Tax=Arcticibacterium luteifluviistationis TaxID=1784714 RepID=A0A2Z4G8L1_9BACT|nr:hypothetical protein [Arcticibacterium luteifluviistationis]AWV97521.1 hypothetical protein DJ013_04815 [Arcticibacterium luteifluviistationis]